MARKKPKKVVEANAYRYAVIGGIAYAQWALPRATRDVDFKVLVPNLDYVSARETLCIVRLSKGLP